MNIWQRKFFSRVLMDQAGGEGGSGGGGTHPTEADITRRIQEAVEREVAGLKTKNSELINAEKALKERLTSFDGIDPVKTREMLARIQQDEDTRLISEGKIDEVINKRTERLRQDFEKKFGEASAATEQALNRAKTYEGRVLDNEIRSAAMKAGVHTHAVDDALFRGRTMFSLGDDGQAVALGSDKRPLMGKDGKTPLTPSEWLESMKETAPHWFPADASGGGASGDHQQGSSNATTMKRAQFERLSQKERADFSKKGGRLID